ncbi:MAG: flavin reductase [Oscillospiraceae bacterium]|nr:flavin reductase [Oscillospiraceae bacterium]
MYNYRKISNDLYWVGANDRRLAMFEGVYSVPDGVSYNAYVLLDEKAVLFDTVDKAVSKTFFENLTAVLGGRKLDYVIVHHMEPDHSAVLADLVLRYPEVKIVCNAATRTMIQQFFDFDILSRWVEAKEGQVFSTGRHDFCFVKAPMVHWPEVMVSYDTTDGILFSADAFGTFGALNGAIFADEVDFDRDYLDEARRYYTNIVGKYGTQVTTLLTKAAMLDIKMVCPLHGFVWRKNIGYFIDKYLHWASYTPEETCVMIAYASVYGNTENAAEILAVKLRERGLRTRIYDVSVTPASEIIAAAFRYSHLVFASTTYNAGVFVCMEALLSDLVAHNIQNRTVALMENGSWAPTAGGLMRKMLEKCKNLNILENTITIRSSLKENQLAQLDAMADAIAGTLPKPTAAAPVSAAVDNNAMFKLSYGLFVLTAREGDKDNGCIINTAAQLTDSPKRIQIAVNKANYTHDMIQRTGVFNVSVLTQDAPFQIFRQFGFCSGRDTDKFAAVGYSDRTANGLRYVPENTNAVISGKVVESYDWGTHTLFVAEVTEAKVLSGDPSVTYQYYFDHIKPKPAPTAEKKSGWVCKICGYVYEGEELPADFVCPLCKHGPEDFEKL